MPPTQANSVLVRRRGVFDYYIIPLLAIVLLTGSSVVFYLRYQSITEVSEQSLIDDTYQLAESLAQFRTFYSKEIVSRATKADLTITHAYRDESGALPLPATFAKDFGDFLADRQGAIKVRLYSDKPFPWRTDEGGPMDAFEREALNALRTNPKEVFAKFEVIDGERVLRYARADVLSESCIGCHNNYPGTPKTDWKIGDVRGVFEVIRPVSSIRDAAKEELWQGLVWFGAVVLVAMLFLAELIHRMRGAISETQAFAIATADANEKLESEIQIRRRAEGNLRVSDEMNRSILASVVDGVIVIDDQCLIVKANQIAHLIFGYEEGKLIGVNINKLVPTEQCIRHEENIIRHIASDNDNQLRHVRMVEASRNNGEVFPIEIALGDIHVGEQRMFCAVIRDVTERQRTLDAINNAHDEAVKSARMKSEFISTMSHEIRTPLNGIVGFADVLSDTDPRTDQLPLINALNTSANNLLHLVDDLLDFSKIESGELKIGRSKFDLDGVIEEVVDQFSSQALDKGLDLLYVTDENVPCFLKGDSYRLRQILNNLVDNALKFTEKGHVIISVSVEGRAADQFQLRFSVGDTGVGIAESNRGRIFDAFSQVDSSSTRQYSGTGLGLAICKRLLNLMDGDIGFESELGQGTTFYFTLRIEGALDKCHWFAPIELDKNARALILEAHSVVGNYLCQQVERFGLEGKHVTEKEQLLAQLRKAKNGLSHYDVVFLDISETERYQEKVLALVNTIKDICPDCIGRIVLLSSHDQTVSAEMFRAAGLAGHLYKPIKYRLLYDLLRRLLCNGKEQHN